MRVSFVALLSLASVGLSFSFSRLGLRVSSVRSQVLYSEPVVPAASPATPAEPASKGFGAAKVNPALTVFIAIARALDVAPSILLRTAELPAARPGRPPRRATKA